VPGALQLAHADLRLFVAFETLAIADQCLRTQ
jgi:hypothetical protein